MTRELLTVRRLLVDDRGHSRTEITFPDVARRGSQRRAAAQHLAGLFPVQVERPASELYHDWGTRMRDGRPTLRHETRRLIVSGPERDVARVCVALTHCLERAEQLTTLAVRRAGRWLRTSAYAADALEYEDAASLRARRRTFRRDVYETVVSHLRQMPMWWETYDEIPPWTQANAYAAQVSLRGTGAYLHLLELIPRAEAEQLLADAQRTVDPYRAQWEAEQAAIHDREERAASIWEDTSFERDVPRDAHLVPAACPDPRLLGQLQDEPVTVAEALPDEPRPQTRQPEIAVARAPRRPSNRWRPRSAHANWARSRARWAHASAIRRRRRLMPAPGDWWLCDRQSAGHPGASHPGHFRPHLGASRAQPRPAAHPVGHHPTGQQPPARPRPGLGGRQSHPDAAPRTAHRPAAHPPAPVRTPCTAPPAPVGNPNFAPSRGQAPARPAADEPPPAAASGTATSALRHAHRLPDGAGHRGRLRHGRLQEHLPPVNATPSTARGHIFAAFLAKPAVKPGYTALS
ncbi:hypothetical protein [Streptomyces sp. Ac-502]|uniref:hypothetical protein n=1 Tax=Streptomyces sp. Ac-502 TaxID=3342801 RepID=UPI00386249E0